MYQESADVDELRRFTAFQLAVQVGWKGDDVLKATPAIVEYLKGDQEIKLTDKEIKND